MSFKKIENKKKSTQVLEQVIEEIRQGNYQIGDKLPPERIIAEQIGVSRTSVREALSVLATSGVVEKRPGYGTYIKSTDQKNISEALCIPEKDGDLFEIFELQRVLEPSVAELAMTKVTDADLTQLKEALDGMRSALEKGDRDRYSDQDRAFHLAIAQATGNSLIQEQVSALIDHMNQRLWRGFKRYSLDFEEEKEYFSQSLETHERMFKVIKNRDQKKIKKIMDSHYERVKNKVFEKDH